MIIYRTEKKSKGLPRCRGEDAGLDSYARCGGRDAAGDSQAIFNEVGAGVRYPRASVPRDFFHPTCMTPRPDGKFNFSTRKFVKCETAQKEKA
jgi:hypothetical protein